MNRISKKLTKKKIKKHLIKRGKEFIKSFRITRFLYHSIRSKRNTQKLHDNFFEILRKEYKANEIFHLKDRNNQKRFNSIEVKRIDVIEGARPQIVWGNKRKEIIKTSEKDLLSESDADLVSSKQRIDLGNDVKIENSFYIVTPSYNSEQYIDATILSVITQEGDFHIHYHIQDGGSTDGTLEKLRKWQDILAERPEMFVRCGGVKFSYESSEDKGMYDAINKGVKKLAPLAQGICTWINSDDVFHGGTFSTICKILQKYNNAYWIIGATNGGNKYQENMSILPLQFPREVIALGLCEQQHWSFIQQEGCFWRGELWNKVGGVSDQLKLAGDWDLWRRFAQFAEPIHVMWPLGKFRIHPEQLTNGKITDYYQEIDSIVPPETRSERSEFLKDYIFKNIKIVELPAYRELECSTVPLMQKYCFIPSKKNVDGRLVRNLLRNLDIPSEREEIIKLLTFNTIAHGGAGTGSMRRIEALRKEGVDAKLLSLISKHQKDYVGQITPTLDSIDTSVSDNVWRLLVNEINRQIRSLKGFKGSEFFSLTDCVLDFRQLKVLFDSVDIVHFHWMVGMFDYNNIHSVLKNKPIVWTTADMNPFTGGCHYSEGCEGFTRECFPCPMVSNETDLPHKTWKIKKKAYEFLNLNIVCPSEYIANLVRKSSLLKNKPVHVIPNAYPVSRFRPMNKAEARSILGLPRDIKLIMFASVSLDSIRKGSDLFPRVAQSIVKKFGSNKVEFMTVGRLPVDLPVKVHNLGPLDEDKVRQAYSAADVFVSLSREDVGPMTVVESLLCGTPVVGFGVGVLPEVVLHNITGICAEPFNINEIILGISRFLYPQDRPNVIKKTCRNTALRYADPKISAMRHKNLYERLLGKI